MSWFVAFVGFAALVVLHEFGHFAAAKAVGMRVEKFSLFFGPMLVKFTRGETTYGIGPIPLGGYVKISGMNPAEEIPPEHAHRAYYRQPPWKRIVVILAGPVVNIVLAFVVLVILFASSKGNEVVPQVASLERGSPAAVVLARGDRIVAVDGKRGEVRDLATQISSHACASPLRDGCVARTPARVTVQRSGRQQTFSLSPRYSAKERRSLVGIRFSTREVPPLGIVDSANSSLDVMWSVAAGTAKVISRLLESEQRKQLSGVVGSYEVTRQSVDVSWTQTFYVLALISLSLGLINLLPLLPLDGGHILWAVVEKVRGRPVSFRVMERSSVVGLALVGILMFIGLQNDIGRIVDGTGFGVR